MKFGRPEWAQLTDSGPHVPCDTPQTPFFTHSGSGSSGSSTVIPLQGGIDHLCQLEFYENSHPATHASFSGMHVHIGSPQKALDFRLRSLIPHDRY